MAYDNLLALQASVTKTATFNSTGVQINGTPRRGMVARVRYSAATNASGSNSVTYQIDVSDDNLTWYALAVANDQVINLSTTAQTGTIHIPFITNKKYVRLTATFAGAGSTPTITYAGEIGASFP